MTRPRRSTQSQSQSQDFDEEEDYGLEELAEEDDMEEEEEEEERKPRRRSKKTSKRKRATQYSQSSNDGNDDDEDDQGEEEEEDDDDEGQGMFSSQAPEMSQDIMPVRNTERNNLLSLDEDAREKVLQDLLRLVLFKGLAGESIDRSKVAKEAGIADARISSAAFDEVNNRLHSIFDFHLARVPKWMENMKELPKKFKERYYMINQAEDNGSHSRAIHSNTTQGAVERGLLMVILGFIFCKGDPRSDGSRWLLDKDLYELLHKVDDNIHSEPPMPGVKRNKRRHQQVLEATPDVDALLHKFVHMDYLWEVKAANNEQLMSINSNADPENMFYSMGPRAVLEIGRSQVVHFCSEALDQDVDPDMLKEFGEDDQR